MNIFLKQFTAYDHAKLKVFLTQKYNLLEVILADYFIISNQ
jgi:hypothetical protein